MPLLLIPFRSGWNGRNISYRHENRYHNTPHSTSDQISAYFGVFQPFWPISAEIHISTSIRCWLKKKYYLLLLLLLLLLFFIFFIFFSSYFLLLLVGFNPSSSFFSSSVFRSCQSPFCFFFCVVQVNGDVFDYLSASLPFLKCFVLNFLFVLPASPSDILFSLVTCVLNFEFFLCYVFVSPIRLTIKIECFSLNLLPMFHLCV